MEHLKLKKILLFSATLLALSSCANRDLSYENAVANSSHSSEEAKKEEAKKEEAPSEEAKEETKEKAPKEEAKKEEAPKNIGIKKEVSKKNEPKKVAQKAETKKEKEAPKQKETPKKETPKKVETPKKEAPKKEEPKNEAPKKEEPKNTENYSFMRNNSIMTSSGLYLPIVNSYSQGRLNARNKEILNWFYTVTGNKTINSNNSYYLALHDYPYGTRAVSSGSLVFKDINGNTRTYYKSHTSPVFKYSSSSGPGYDFADKVIYGHYKNAIAIQTCINKRGDYRVTIYQPR